MELKKQSWNTHHEIAPNGSENERIDSINYNILDTDGNVIGSANIGNGYGYANFNLSGFATIEEGEEKMQALFGELNG